MLQQPKRFVRVQEKGNIWIPEGFFFCKQVCCTSYLYLPKDWHSRFFTSSRGISFANGRAGVVTVNMFFSLDHQLVQRVEKPLFSLNKWSNLQIKTLARCIFNNHKNQRELVTMNIQHMHFVSENLIWILFFLTQIPFEFSMKLSTHQTHTIKQQ